MNDETLRAMIRQAIARQQGGDRQGPVYAAPLPVLSHASHFRYALPDSGGPCLIEPAVACNHCGYCQSHGH
ncbi:hypothetical protein BH23ACI1_BH23ACI1_05920 [soil metagenome]|nr:hypothetical protein [Acidobacteriota bacterium]